MRRLLLFVTLAAVLGPAASAASAQAPYDNEPPEVQVVGNRLACARGGWEGSRVRFTYAWLRDGARWATGRAYRMTAADRGHAFTCVVKGSNREGSEEEESWNAVESARPGEVPL